MKVQTKSSIFFFVALLIFGWQFVDAYQVKAQRMPTNPLSEEERKLHDELEQDSSITQISCKEENPNLIFFGARKFSNQVKMALHKASASNDSVVKARKLCSTKEGTIIASYLLVNKGKITFIADYSRDGFSSGRILSETCDSLALGSYVWIKDEKGARYEFQSASKTEKDKVTFMLRCEKKQNDAKPEKVF